MTGIRGSALLHMFAKRQEHKRGMSFKMNTPAFKGIPEYEKHD